MGIRGFDSFIRSRVAGEVVCLSASGGSRPQTLIVDGNGFAHYLCSARGLGVWRGCDIDAIDEMVEWFLVPFRCII